MKTDEIQSSTPPKTAQQLELSLPQSSSPVDELQDREGKATLPKKPLWPILTLVMIVIATLVGWRAYHVLSSAPGTEETDEASSSVSRLPVKTVRSQLAPIQRWVTSPDSDVRVERYKQLIFETSGEIIYLAKINGRFLREGDRVKKGQLLARIDDREYTSNIRSAKAELEVARRSQRQAIASLNQAKANLEQAQADLNLAKVEAQRRETLFKQGVVPATERDSYANRVVQAEVGVKVAQADIESAQDQVVASQASFEASQATLNNQIIAKEDTELIAPIDGVVAYLNIREGEYWSTSRVQSANDYQAAVESVPIVIVDEESFEVALELPAFEGSLIQPNQPAYIALDDDVSAAFVKGLTQQNLVSVAKARGSVFSVTPAVTPGGRAVQVRIRITSGLENLRLGERVQTWIAAESKASAITLPFGAVTTRDRQSYVFVVNPATKTVEQRPVVLDIEGLDRISIAEGLRPGELVVTEGSNRLVDGSPVEVVDAP